MRGVSQGSLGSRADMPRGAHHLPNPCPLPCAAMAGDSPLRRAALSAAPRLPNGSLPAAAAAASPAGQHTLSTLSLLDSIGQVGTRWWSCAVPNLGASTQRSSACWSHARSMPALLRPALRPP